jgi:hypothetical protein
MQNKKKEGLDLNELISALNFKFNIRYENLDTEKQKAILKAWNDLGGPIDYKKNPHLKENVVAATKLDDILKQNKQEWDKIKSGDLELMDSNKLYDELFTYFSSEMPYRVAKARDGDPDEWILNKLEQMGYLGENIQEGDEDFHSQKMIKNQLNTIVRNSTTCLQMIEAGRKFPEWAQSEIAVAEDGIVSVTEFMESHQTALGEDLKLDEAVATPAVKKLIDGIDNLSPKEYFNFLQMLSNHATDISNAAQPVNGVSNGLAWYQVSNHIRAAAKAYSERPVKI